MTEDKDFTLFKSEFTKWQQMFGLTGYKVYFGHEPLKSGFANIVGNNGTAVVKVTLTNKIPPGNEAFKDIKRSAKHEAIHLLLRRLVQSARHRHSTAEEISEAVEELAYKLEALIGE